MRDPSGLGVGLSAVRLIVNTHWFRETVDLYFGGDYNGKYCEIMEGFMKRGVVMNREGSLFTTVKPRSA